MIKNFLAKIKNKINIFCDWIEFETISCVLWLVILLICFIFNFNIEYW